MDTMLIYILFPSIMLLTRTVKHTCSCTLIEYAFCKLSTDLADFYVDKYLKDSWTIPWTTALISFWFSLRNGDHIFGNRTSSCYDGISIELLKYVSLALLESLTLITDQSLITGSFLVKMEIAKVQCASTTGWTNNRYAGDLRRHRAHYDVNVMRFRKSSVHTTVKIPSKIMAYSIMANVTSEKIILLKWQQWWFPSYSTNSCLYLYTLICQRPLTPLATMFCLTVIELRKLPYNGSIAIYSTIQCVYKLTQIYLDHWIPVHT